MPRKKPDLLSSQREKVKVDVTIQTSNLKDGSGKTRTYGSVSHRKVTIRQILAELEENHSTLASKELMFYVAQELSQLMMDKFRQGYAVELMGFGTMFPTMRGSIRETDTPSTIAKHFDVGFTPSKKARDAIKNLTVRHVLDVPQQHYITSVSSTLQKESDKSIPLNAIVRMTGKSIKLGGPACGLYAAPVSRNWSGTQLPDRSTWIKQEHVCRNTPSTLEFFLDGMTEGKWVFIVETSLSAGGKTLKQSVLFHSQPVKVSAAIKLG
ncbi:MAG: DUF4469 domain-containing protein [Treponema sp.]|nr:DUF4469 domain-containing protein [Treponema sp.]